MCDLNNILYSFLYYFHHPFSLCWIVNFVQSLSVTLNLWLLLFLCKMLMLAFLSDSLDSSGDNFRKILNLMISFHFSNWSTATWSIWSKFSGGNENCILYLNIAITQFWRNSTKIPGGEFHRDRFSKLPPTHLLFGCIIINVTLWCVNVSQDSP